MPKTKTLQTNFSAGELDPNLDARQDTEQYQNGARSLHNRRVLVTGGVERRPGTWKQPVLTQVSRLRRWVVDRSTQYVAAFSQGRVDFFSRNTSTGALTAAGNLTSCPWTGTIWQELKVAQAGNTMFVVAAGMQPQVLKRTGASSWTRTAFAFATGVASRPEQPYIKFADPAATLQPSALTGSITLTVSGAGAWFTANHVGCHIRYQKRACVITAVAGNGLSCTATVLETLPATYSLTVGSSANFAIGEVVTGSVTGAKGVVTAIPSGTSVTVVLTEKLIAFTSSDKLVGPQADSQISAASTTTNAAVEDWDEQVFSAVFGWPTCVALHRNRLLFGGHESAPDYLFASVLADLYNFDVGDSSDGDAIAEQIGDANANRIVHLHSAEQLLVATDNGLYYVPETAQSPFRPSSLAFFPFGTGYAISENVIPIAYDDGVLFAAGNNILLARPTGDLSRAWRVDEVSLLSPHLFKTPGELTVVSSFAGGVERYAVFANEDDGSLAVLQVIDAQKIRNCTPWETDRESDTFNSVCAIDSSLYVHSTREIDGDTVQTLELFDQAITLDYASELADVETSTVEAEFGEEAVNVVTESGYHLGQHPVTLDEIPAGPYIVGLLYDSEIETLPPVIEGDGGSQVGEYMRIVEAQVMVRSSARFAANGLELQAYQVSDDPSAPPPPKTGPQRFQFLGWRKEPTIRITQPDPLPHRVLGIKMEVAF